VQRSDIADWFNQQIEGNLDGDYCHLRLSQKVTEGWRPLLSRITAYWERAHSDARNHFNELIGSSLDPLGAPPFDYPKNLPIKTLKGYFGETFCGLLAEVIEIVGRHTWSVPVFLFRFHQQAGEYLTRLITGETANTTIPGRTGSDFVGLRLSESGEIKAFLVAESKCHEVFNIGAAKKALSDLSSGAAIPVSLPQLKQILKIVNSESFAPTIRSIEQIMLSGVSCDLPRTDMLVYIFDRPGVMEYLNPRISDACRAENYTCGRHLQVVEIHIPDAGELIKTVYNRLYLKPEDLDASA
jgi:hypothetical protein